MSGRGLRHSLTGCGAVSMPMPTIEQIHVEDLAHSIAQVARFGGWLVEQFSVAQHSLEVGRLMRMVVEGTVEVDRSTLPVMVDPDAAELVGMIHDLHEGVVGDQISPAKRELGSVWAAHESEAERLVHRALGVEGLMRQYGELLAWADAEMVVSDVLRWGTPGTYLSRRGDFVVRVDRAAPEGFALRFANARAMTWRAARHAYLKRYFHLRDVLFARKLLSAAPARLPYVK